jgi:hypothetical protein
VVSLLEVEPAGKAAWMGVAIAVVAFLLAQFGPPIWNRVTRGDAGTNAPEIGARTRGPDAERPDITAGLGEHAGDFYLLVDSLGSIVAATNSQGNLAVSVSGANRDFVSVEHGVGREYGHPLDLGLGDQQSIERIPVMMRQARDL